MKILYAVTDFFGYTGNDSYLKPVIDNIPVPTSAPQ